MNKLLTKKTKVFEGIWLYREFRIERIKRGRKTWIITQVTKNHKDLKGKTAKTVKELCLLLDVELGDLKENELPKKTTKSKSKKKQIIDLEDLDVEKLFLDRNINGKLDNDTYNKQREDCLLKWFKNEFIDNTDQEKKLIFLLQSEMLSQGMITILSVKKLAGLQSRDFEITYIDGNQNKLTKYIEFKSTQSKNPNSKNMLYQKYTKNSNYLGNGIEKDYAKYYYENYVPKLKEYYNIKDEISLEDYKKFVYTMGKNKGTPKFFSELKRKQVKDKFDKYDNKRDSYCNTMSKESIDKFLEKHENEINIGHVESDLNDAIIGKKDFWLVWSQLNRSFKLSKTYKIKINKATIFKGHKDLRNSFVLDCVWLDKNGEVMDTFKVEMRMRWKNHNGVFGIAWQFSQK